MSFCQAKQNSIPSIIFQGPYTKQRPRRGITHLENDLLGPHCVFGSYTIYVDVSSTVSRAIFECQHGFGRKMVCEACILLRSQHETKGGKGSSVIPRCSFAGYR